MLRFLIQKLKEAPGPLKQTRLVLGDLTEEILDLAEYYWKQRNARDNDPGCDARHAPCCEPAPPTAAPPAPSPVREEEPQAPAEPSPSAVTPVAEPAKVVTPGEDPPSPKKKAAPPPPKKMPKVPDKPIKATAATKASKPAPAKTNTPRTDLLEVDGRLAEAIADPANAQKQEFKVLAILWDVAERGHGAMNASDLSTHGEQIGLIIRHENIRKVIRLRLGEYVETLRFAEEGGNMYGYRLSDAGKAYFEDAYLS